MREFGGNEWEDGKVEESYMGEGRVRLGACWIGRLSLRRVREILDGLLGALLR